MDYALNDALEQIGNYAADQPPNPVACPGAGNYFGANGFPAPGAHFTGQDFGARRTGPRVHWIWAVVVGAVIVAVVLIVSILLRKQKQALGKHGNRDNAAYTFAQSGSNGNVLPNGYEALLATGSGVQQQIQNNAHSAGQDQPGAGGPPFTSRWSATNHQQQESNYHDAGAQVADENLTPLSETIGRFGRQKQGEPRFED